MSKPVFKVGMADANALTMNMTVEFNRAKMMKSIIYLLALAGALLATSFARAGEDRPVRATIEHSVRVKHVNGSAEYAYDSTGWRPLIAGKILHAGASVRTGDSSSVVLAMEEQGSLVRVGSMHRLELAAAAPSHETSVTIVPLQASLRKTAASAPELAAK
jgi:hypothetical protein